MYKKIHNSNEAREGLMNGVNALAEAVIPTLGPAGRNVVISSMYKPVVVTKDGVSVAEAVILEDQFLATGANIVKQAARKTAEQAGDGTTSSIVLAQKLCPLGLEYVNKGSKPVDLKKGMDKAVAAVVSEIANIAKPVTYDHANIKHIASISANNNEEIGELVANAMAKVKDGTVTVEMAQGMETYVKHVEGMQFDRGYIAREFVNNKEKMLCELVNPVIVLCAQKATSMRDLLPIFEASIHASRPILLIAEDIEGEVLATLAVNVAQGRMRGCAVKAPSFGENQRELLNDLAALTGAAVVDPQLGIKFDKLTLDKCGSADKVTISRDSTTIIGGKGTETQNRATELRAQAETVSSEFQKKQLIQRASKLTGGIAVLYVGAPTEVEAKEKLDRVEDAVCATRAAVEEGIVAGGGSAYLKCLTAVQGLNGSNDDEQNGITMVYNALYEPLRRICINAGVFADDVLLKVSTGELGYNAKTGQFEDLLATGVIDPAKVVRCAIENAASVAGIILSTECVLEEYQVK